MQKLLFIAYGEHGRVVDGEKPVCSYIFASFHVKQFPVERIELQMIFEGQFQSFI